MTQSWQTKLIAQINAADFWSESDTEDFCNTHGIPLRKALRVIAENTVKNTPCEGCIHIELAGSGMYPCNSCSRRMKDLYEPSVSK